MLAVFLQFSSSFSPRSVILGEWDIFTGFSPSTPAEPSYYAEFHQRASDRSSLIATI
jgi:hypothetical protein